MSEIFRQPRNTLDAQHSSRKLFETTLEPLEGRQQLKSHSKSSWSLFALVTFEAMIVIALQAVIFAKFRPTPFSEKQGMGIPVYLMIFIFSQVFQVALVWDAIRMQNTIQIIAFWLFNLCCLVYTVIQFKQIDDVLAPYHSNKEASALAYLIKRLLIANAVVIGVWELVYIYYGKNLYQEFGWRIYKKIGADPEMRNMYRWYQIFLTIVKLDIFFFLGYSIQYLVLVLSSGDVEFPLTIIALPLTCLFLILAVYAIRHESRILISLFFVGLVAGCAYFIFKIYRIYDPSQAYKYTYVRAFLTFFASVSLLLLMLTIANAAICWYNFNNGLKERLLRDTPMDHTGRDGERPLSLD